MNLKPTFIFSCLFFIAFSGFAQEELRIPYFQKLYTSKNRILYGGSISFQSPVSDLKILHIGIQPQLGGFVANNLAILGILHASYGTNGEPSRFIVNAGGGVELRYYIGHSSTKFYLHGNAIPHYVHYNNHDFGIMSGGGAGVAFFTGPLCQEEEPAWLFLPDPDFQLMYRYMGEFTG
jgi:hypothetical protein